MHELLNREVSPDDPIGIVIPWDRHEMKTMAEQWQNAKAQLMSIQEAIDLIEEDVPQHCGAIVDLMAVSGCNECEDTREYGWFYTQRCPPWDQTT